MLESDLGKLSTFHTKGLWKILRTFWPQTISNKDLLSQCKQEDMGTIFMQRRWRWIGHVTRKDNESITKTALFWTPEGRRKCGRPKNTWRRTVEAELRGLKQSWNKIQQLAKDRQKWKNFVASLCASGHNGQWVSVSELGKEIADCCLPFIVKCCKHFLSLRSSVA